MKDIQKVKWSDIRESVVAANQGLAEAIDEIAPEDQPTLYLAEYLFGEPIIDARGLNIHYNENLHSIHDEMLPTDLRKDLDYTRVPAMICLNKTTEYFTDFNERVFPIHLLEPGTMMGAWEILDKSNTVYQHQIWRVVAGARTLFMLPKITDQLSHSKMLRSFGLSELPPPHNLFNQGKIFANIAQAPFLNCKWRAQVLIFGRGWFEQAQESKMKPFYNLLLEQAWCYTRHSRNHMFFEIIWQFLAQAQAQTRLKPNVYVLETVKHLINISTGSVMAFAPLQDQDDRIAPVKTLQQAYLEEYGLKHYIPSIMAPAYLKRTAKVYYSFLVPTLLSLSPNYSFRNILEDERNIKNLLEHFFKQFAEHYASCGDLFGKAVKFEFFHFEADPLHGIHASHSLPQFDPDFSHFAEDPNRIFCENGPFIRACVQISRD
ncbi:MAG: hypothetical protein NTV32_04735 [Gammaproteobacteria bacterium]|nr:hypothetical protein [Gammaproteobacteria bacterium]